MPVGQKDKRRGGHRCLRCRSAHIKCDGLKPCTSCKRQRLVCEEHVTDPSEIRLVEYRVKPTKPAIGRSLVIDEWCYISIFFNAIGCSSSPLFHAFTIENIGHLIHTDGRVYNAVAASGATYSQKNSALPSLSPEQNVHLKRASAKLRTATKKALQQETLLEDSPLLLCALILSFIELMTDESANRWRSLIRQIWQQAQQQQALTAENYFDIALIKFLRLSNALGALLFREEETELTITFETSLTTEVASPFDVQQSSTALLLMTDKYDRLVRILENWAQLQKWSDELILRMTCESDMHASLTPSDPIEICIDRSATSADALQGLKIIHMASKLQEEIMSTILLDADHVPYSVKPYYHWMLAGLSKMFLSSTWLSFGWHLPVMEQSLLYDQAITALDLANERVAKAGLDAAFYLPIFPFIGTEMRDAADRQRAIDFIRAIGDKGFVVAESLEQHIKEVWMNDSAVVTGEDCEKS